jgi:hypothetical protein
MAAGEVLLDSWSEEFSHDQAYYGIYRYDNCVTLESQLKEALLELSSSKFIIKLLYKELHDDSAIYKPVRDAIVGSGDCEESALPTAWSKVASKYSGGKNESVNSELLHSERPISVSNRYAVLTDLLESTIEEDEVASLRREKVTQLFTNNYKKSNEQRGVKNPLIKHRFVQRSSFPSFRVSGSGHGSNYTNDSYPNYIPTLVNGQVRASNKDGNRQFESDNKSYVQMLLCESTRKLIVNKQKFSNCRKHKVLLIGDSHLRGCAAHMKVFLNDQFEVLGYVKPGASSKSVMESVKSDIEKLTMDDFLIMCSGSNDAKRIDFRKVFHDVINFVKSVKHTNVILVSIPCRYDLIIAPILMVKLKI